MAGIRKQQAEATRRKILDAVVELINGEPINEISIQGIIKKADVSVGAFYQYFASKEDALLANYREDKYDYSDFPYTDSPAENARLIIIDFYKKLFEHRSLNDLRNIAIAQLVRKDPYFCCEEFPFYSALNKELDKIDGVDSAGITRSICEFLEGKIFSFSVRSKGIDSSECIRCINETLYFLDVLLAPPEPAVKSFEEM